MLGRLSIQNYAIIDQLQIDFSSRLNIITGETGAGKSIIVGAMGLILGQRADSNVLLNKDNKCIVEGIFHIQDVLEKVRYFLNAHDLDEHEELVVRREVSPNGKSRAFINDTPVNLYQLTQLSSLLVDLHQQFDTLELEQTEFQREVLDALAGNFPVIQDYRKIFEEAQLLVKKLEALNSDKAQFERELDYHKFQFNELKEADFKENELEDLEQELKLLSNAEEIKGALTKAYFELEENEDAINSKIKILLNHLQQFSDVHPSLPSLAERLQSVYIELQDIADEADRMNDHVNYDAAIIEKINDRLSSGYRLLKKHGVKTTNDLLAIKDQLEQKLQAVLNIDDEIEATGKSYQSILAKVQEQALKISDARKAQVKPLEQQVNKMLSRVGMPNARVRVEVQKLASLQQHGMDAIEFLFDANLPAGQAGKSNQFQPLRRVASGGELSRLMLCIKSLVAASINLPTLIFDEIDTGISGEAAKQVGIIMKELAASRQVISITHQPQIAGKANTHLLVYKAIKNNTVTTGVKELSTDERIVAIAKMLSGEKPTAAALENAREMVMN
ncbi:MAG: DNA repair protein RecN [Chitinophagaceae bacterium]